MITGIEAGIHGLGQQFATLGDSNRIGIFDATYFLLLLLFPFYIQPIFIRLTSIKSFYLVRDVRDVCLLDQYSDNK